MIEFSHLVAVSGGKEDGNEELEGQRSVIAERAKWRRLRACTKDGGVWRRVSEGRICGKYRAYVLYNSFPYKLEGTPMKREVGRTGMLRPIQAVNATSATERDPWIR